MPHSWTLSQKNSVRSPRAKTLKQPSISRANHSDLNSTCLLQLSNGSSRAKRSEDLARTGHFLLSRTIEELYPAVFSCLLMCPRQSSSEPCCVRTGTERAHTQNPDELAAVYTSKRSQKCQPAWERLSYESPLFFLPSFSRPSSWEVGWIGSLLFIHLSSAGSWM